ncbi:serine aminopeptidase domain-containing protein [Sphingomonas sp. Leaf33]|uniref:serine aminopeptidase domain-containing protein n=1 Tax=Sphingomonas sp. Leaf33 TaxID=1736215 RepID=UPI000A90E176|nr:alpha/beta hydrolase [Sphingomonas sp. Leaf33]
MDRRTLIGGIAGASALLAARPLLAAERITDDDVALTVGTRETRLFRVRPARPRGVVLFSTGHGSWPDRYAVLTRYLAAQGWAVLAPLHVDSMRYPDRAKFTMQASFGERIADMGAAAAVAAKDYPGLPVIAVGHSFGTLVALCLGGALSYIAPFRMPAVKAVLGFSTPGKIPGLVQPTAYTSLAVPAMIVTGTADTVPGFVTDPADHLFVGQTAGKAAYTLVAKDGGHELVADAVAMARVLPAVDLFVAAYGTGDAQALKKLQGWTAPAGDRFVVKAA